MLLIALFILSYLCVICIGNELNLGLKVALVYIKQTGEEAIVCTVNQR